MFIEVLITVMLSTSVFAADEVVTATPSQEQSDEATSLKLYNGSEKAEVTKPKHKNESDIPVVLGSPEKAKKSGMYTAKRAGFSVVIAFAILGGFYVFMKKWTKKSVGNRDAKSIKILSQHHLGPRKSLAVVSVSGEAMLVGITDHNISLIKSLSLLEEEIPDQTPRNFKNSLSQQDFAADEANETPTENEVEEEYAIAGIKDIVSDRLKNMRKLV